MLGLNQYYAFPTAGGRARSLSPAPRIAKVWVGDVPMALLLAPHSNVLFGVAVNRLTPQVTEVLARIVAGDPELNASASFAAQLDVGLLYLSVAAESAMARVDPMVSCMVIKSLLRGALLEKVIAPMALIEGGAS